MHQQINLFQPIFRKERKLFSSVVSLYVVLVFLAGMLSMYAYAQYQLNNVSHQLKVLKSENNNRLRQLAKLTEELKANGVVGSGANQAARLQAELTAQHHLLTVLGDIYQQHRNGFSSYLEGFARRSIRGMWMSSFEMKNGGKTLSITGGTIDPALVPRFIEGLSQEPVLRGISFQLLNMQRKEADGGWVDFTLSSDRSVNPMDERR